MEEEFRHFVAEVRENLCITLKLQNYDMVGLSW
jgi:hypothetical protein